MNQVSVLIQTIEEAQNLRVSRKFIRGSIECFTAQCKEQDLVLVFAFIVADTGLQLIKQRVKLFFVEFIDGK